MYINAEPRYQNFNPLPSCEGRPILVDNDNTRADFNPLPSCEGRRFDGNDSPATMIFQSTPLMRGETMIDSTSRRMNSYFNPLPSCEGRPLLTMIINRYYNISIHSPHARGDRAEIGIPNVQTEFQSTPLMRGETRIYQ